MFALRTNELYKNIGNLQSMKGRMLVKKNWRKSRIISYFTVFFCKFKQIACVVITFFVSFQINVFSINKYSNNR